MIHNPCTKLYCILEINFSLGAMKYAICTDLFLVTDFQRKRLVYPTSLQCFLPFYIALRNISLMDFHSTKFIKPFETSPGDIPNSPLLRLPRDSSEVLETVKS